MQNNILGQQKHALCDVARVVTNVVFSGATCPGDRQGNPHLIAGRPTAESSPLLANGTKTGAPATDITGRKRSRPPSIGAYNLP